ncbi:MAG: hypothetical protein CM15mP106_3780 [Candidatus Neomarinimicrobiota bacterium]|nr:MAG: hypothetical protein CM15mP106_3780 [Candidatus Neomarinimicrobiota bacterium]
MQPQILFQTGKSSLVIKIDAYKESKEIDKTLACTARFTFVSVQKDQFGTYQKINHNSNYLEMYNLKIRHLETSIFFIRSLQNLYEDLY